MAYRARLELLLMSTMPLLGLLGAMLLLQCLQGPEASR
jgi:hypothetical protein